MKHALCLAVSLTAQLALGPLALGAQEAQPSAPAGEPAAGAKLELTLEQAIQIALGNDLGLQLQELSAEGSRYDAAGSWGAFDPVLTATGSVFDAEFEATSPFSGTAVIEENTLSFGTGVKMPLTTGGTFGATFDLNNTESNNSLAQGIDLATTDVFSLEFRQPLLNGFGSDYATSLQSQADLEYRGQLEQCRKVRQDLIASVTVAYWDLVSALNQLEVAQESLDLAKTQQDQNERRLEAGVGTQVEVLQAEANVAQRQELKLLRQTEVKAAGDRLKAILYPGTDPQTWEAEILPSTALPEPPPAALELIPRWGSAWVEAQEKRSELRQQRLQIEWAEIQLTRAVSERRPSLDLLLASRSRGFDGESSQAFDKALGWDYPQNTAALIFSFPLGNRSGRNAYERARADLRAARLVYDQIESQIIADVRTALRQVEYSVQAVAAADTSHRLADKQLRAEEARYREGLSTNFQVLEYQQQLAQAAYSRNLARANLAKSLVNLQKSRGILGEPTP